MEKAFKPDQWEDSLYSFWETKGYLKPGKGEPYTVLMPPPNANASLHAGHGMFTVDDVIVRWKRLNGFASQWLPGMDHAGFETQFVYEKHLRKQNKSRFDFDRKTLYDNIYDFVKENSGTVYGQFKKLGFLADWDESVFTLDDHVVKYVYETFKMMVDDGLVYRDEYIVNYCLYDGTSLADLEVDYIERTDALYYIKYPLIDATYEGKDYITVATVRPEPIYIDTHLAVHPDNPKTKVLIGRKVRNPLTDAEMEIIADDFVDPEFGTGIVKLTPGHDPHDFDVARKHNLPIKQAIDLRGRMIDGPYDGLKVKQARDKALEDLREKDLIEKVDEEYEHSVPVCYKCGRDIEPLTVPNWFVKVDTLKAKVIEVVKAGDVQFHPAKYKEQMLQWLDVMHDWPISRQIVWGIRIPVWYKITSSSDVYVAFIDTKGNHQYGAIQQFLADGVSLDDMRDGLQNLYAMTGKNAPEYVISEEQLGEDYLPETDVFDTWFSSGQWPMVTVKNADDPRYPTDFMGTMHDILKFWISRMIMFSLYRRDTIPFKDVYLWSMVADQQGKKMSKSKGNVINPVDLIEKYGADAFRGALFFGVAMGGKVNLGEDKVKAMRNYANKLWNIGRFLMLQERNSESTGGPSSIQDVESEWAAVKDKCIKNMDEFNFSRVFDDMYEFVWHRFADHYIELLKEDIKSGNIEVLEAMENIFQDCLTIIHPFMPFVTEALWKEMNGKDVSILDTTISR